MKIHKIFRKIIAIAISFCLSLTVHTAVAHAAPNVGPDPDNTLPSTYYGSSFPTSIKREARYVVSHDAGPTDITTTKVKVYLTSPSGSITILDPHMCTNLPYVSASPYSYYKSHEHTYSASTGNVVRYQITNASGGSAEGYGKWNSASNCASQQIVINVTGASLDPATGMYPYFLTATAIANGLYINQFSVMGPADSIVSPDVTQSSQSFGMLLSSPTVPGSNTSESSNPPDPLRNYATWELPFGPDCSVTTPTVRKYIEVFDDDGTEVWVQPRPFWLQLREYSRDGTYKGVVRPSGMSWLHSGSWGPIRTSPQTDWAGGWEAESYNGTPYEFMFTSENRSSFRAYYDFKRDSIYRLVAFNVYYDNTVQFQMPFEQVYYYKQCQMPAATLEPSSTVDKATITFPETATFRHFLNATNVASASTANYSIQRYRNGVAVGSPQTGSTNFSGNGQLTIAQRPYSSSQADLGARICERLTLTDPAGTMSINGNPSEACTTVLARPYLTVTNNDVWAGGNMDYANNKCTGLPARNSTITSWVSNGAGSVVEYGLFALGAITEFGSARQAGGSGLTFANTPSFGSLGSSTRCIANYYSSIGTGGAEAWPGMGSIPANAGYKKYVVNGNLTIAGGTIPAGTRVTLMVNGNVKITGNITYADNYTSRENMSALRLVSNSNIVIQENVTSISGLYIAQGKSTAPGQIHTCIRAGQDTTYTPLTTTTCANGLDVYGAFIADKIFWQRTRGTAAPGQTYAEGIQFDPGLYLTGFSSNTTGLDVQNLIELPPIY